MTERLTMTSEFSVQLGFPSATGKQSSVSTVQASGLVRTCMRFYRSQAMNLCTLPHLLHVIRVHLLSGIKISCFAPQFHVNTQELVLLIVG